MQACATALTYCPFLQLKKNLYQEIEQDMLTEENKSHKFTFQNIGIFTIFHPIFCDVYFIVDIIYVNYIVVF